MTSDHSENLPIDRPRGAFRAMLEATLEARKAAARPLLIDAMELEARLKETKERAEVIARQAFGLLLSLGYTEEQARKELQSWRPSAS